MIQYEGKTLLTTAEACNILNRSMEALRQMIYRGQFTKTKIGSRIYLDNGEVLAYFPKKLKLPSFESLQTKDMEECVTFAHVKGLLNYSHIFLKKLLKKGLLIGYATSDGLILIPKKSLDKYMGVNSDVADL